MAPSRSVPAHAPRATILALCVLFGACRSRPTLESARTAAQVRALEEAAPLADSLADAETRRDQVAALRLACLRFARLQSRLAIDDPQLVLALVDLGAAHHRCGQLERAESELRRAAADAVISPERRCAVRARADLELGLLVKDLGRAPESRSWYERALREIRSCEQAAPGLASRIDQALGHWELRWGDVEAALRWFERGRAAVDGTPGVSLIERTDAKTWYGFALLRAGRHDDAARQFRDAIAMLERPGEPDPPAMRSALDLLSVVEMVRGQPVSAESLLRRSTRLADDEMVRLPRGFGVGISHPSLRLGLVDLLLGENRPEDAWEESQVWSGWVTDALMAGAPHAAGSAPHASFELSDRLRALDATILASAAPADERENRESLRRFAERAAIEATLLAGDAETDTVSEPRPRILGALQGVLAADEALVGWTQVSWDDDARRGGRHVVWAYVIRSRGPVHWVRLGAWDREARFRAWRGDLDTFAQRLNVAAGWGIRVPDDPGLEAAGVRVHEKLVAPLLPELTGVRRLLVVYQVLNRWIPLECLAGPDGRTLAEKFEIAYVPSARTLVELRRRPVRAAGSGFRALVLGDPDYSGRAASARAETTATTDWTRASISALEPTVVRSVLAGERSVASLPPLPHSLAEARAVAGHLPGAMLLTGATASGASLEMLRREGRLSGFSLLHFATHALVDDAIPERSAIALAPGDTGDGTHAAVGSGGGLLRADEVLARWRLGADLVVLSSCQAAGGRFTWSAQSLGLAQSFLGAGSRCLLISPWKVDDLATRALMDEFSARLGRSLAGRAHRLGACAALRDARLALRDFRAPDGSRPFAHPVYWASFILVGDPGVEVPPADVRERARVAGPAARASR